MVICPATVYQCILILPLTKFVFNWLDRSDGQKWPQQIVLLYQSVTSSVKSWIECFCFPTEGLSLWHEEGIPVYKNSLMMNNIWKTERLLGFLFFSKMQFNSCSFICRLLWSLVSLSIVSNVSIFTGCVTNVGDMVDCKVVKCCKSLNKDHWQINTKHRIRFPYRSPGWDLITIKDVFCW